MLPLSSAALGHWGSRASRLLPPSLAVVSRPCNTAAAVVPPARIPRGPTDLLKAVAATVPQDRSGPHYKYHDDPYLTPASSLAKRTYALSRESGRKAARWIKDTNPELFSHLPDDPVIKSFQARAGYDEVEGQSEQLLQELTTNGQVTDAINVFNLCHERGIELSGEVQQRVLELVCYYNSQEPLDEAWVEERWYRQSTLTIRNTWKANGFADELYQAMESKGPAAYCAMIRGMAKFYQVERAWSLYHEARDLGYVLDVDTYNCLISISPFLREADKFRWKELLATMAAAKVRPNVGTLNGCLEVLGQQHSHQSRDLSLELLRDMLAAGVRPSLATYYLLLVIHCRERGPTSHILLDILDEVEGQEFTVRHLKDTFFFVTAMDVARNHLQSLEVAQRVDRLLNTANNRCFIGDSYKQTIYYRHYFGLCCSQLEPDQLMDLYSDLVPHVYTPEPSVMEGVVGAVALHGALGHLPGLYSDMLFFELGRRERLLAQVLAAAASPLPPDHPPDLPQRLAAIASDVWTRVQDQDETLRTKVVLTGVMVGDLLATLLRAGHLPLALQVLARATAAPHTILGPLPPPPLRLLLQAAIQAGDGDAGVNVVMYSLDCGHMETGEMATLLCSSLPLTPPQRAKLTTALGPDFMASPSPPDQE